MTLSKHGDKQICSISRVSFLSECPTSNSLPKHLNIMVYKAIGLRVVFQYHLSPHGNLEQMDKDLSALSIGSTYSLASFIPFGGFTYWIYLLALFIRLGGFIYWVYLLALVSAYTVSMLLGISFRFSHSSERNTFTFLSLYISHVFMEKIFRLPLRYHSGLIKLTLLQLHHRTSLIKLTNIASLHHIYYTCSILTLHYFSIISHYSISTHLQIPSDIQLLHLPSIFILLAQKCASYSISNYIWNTSKLLLLSGDLEINPGPRPIDQNPAFCTICFRKINRGPHQDMAPTYSYENCNVRCHQACNGLPIGQTRHTKDSGHSITWKFPPHGTGIAEIIIPPAPVYKQPNRSSSVGKSCSVCKNSIRIHYDDLAYHCANPSCSNVFHLAATCSGFVNPRGIA